MKKYEYNCYTIKGDRCPDCDKINEWASHGWELVSVAGGQRPDMVCDPTWTTYFFKREITTD